MCVGRCTRGFIVHAVVVYREVLLLLRPPRRKRLRPVLWEEQSAERVWPREASAEKGEDGTESAKVVQSAAQGTAVFLRSAFVRSELKERQGRDLQEVCLPSADGETRGACGRRSVREERPEPEGRVGDLPRE